MGWFFLLVLPISEYHVSKLVQSYFYYLKSSKLLRCRSWYTFVSSRLNYRRSLLTSLFGCALFAPLLQVHVIGRQGCPLGLTGCTCAQCPKALLKLKHRSSRKDSLRLLCFESFIVYSPHNTQNAQTTVIQTVAARLLLAPRKENISLHLYHHYTGQPD